MVDTSLLVLAGVGYLLAALAVALHANRHGRNPVLWGVACLAAPFTGFLIYGLWHVAGEPTYERSADAEVEAAERAQANATRDRTD
jgi:hypothetical protein